MNEETIESRGNGSIYGKCTERCDLTIAEDTNERLITLARLNGMSKAEYCRLVIERHIYGAGCQLSLRDPLMGS